MGEEIPAQVVVFPRFANHTLDDLAVADALNVTDIVSCDPLALPGLVPVGERDGLHLYKNTGAFGRAALRG